MKVLFSDGLMEKKKLSLLQWNYQNGIRVYQRVIFLMKEIWKRI